MTRKPRRYVGDPIVSPDLGAPGIYDSSMFWIYSRDRWDPSWWHKIGVPSLGGDEWGRRTIVVGLWFLGYVCWAYRTCWCQECHEVREQTYRMLNENWAAGNHDHFYVSTSCQHRFHGRCGKLQRQRGERGVPHCKHCTSPCACWCHHGWKRVVDE